MGGTVVETMNQGAVIKIPLLIPYLLTRYWDRNQKVEENKAYTISLLML
jgi:hypothetical protein